TGTGLAGELEVSRSSVSFGTAAVGSTSAGEELILTATGSAVTLTDFTFTDGAFTRAGGSCGDAGSSIAAGESCSILLQFAPTALGTADGVFRIVHDGAVSPADVQLTGVGAAPQPIIDPALVDFGPVPVDELSDPVTVTLTNASDVELAVGSFGFAGGGSEFEVDANTCENRVLAAQESCSLDRKSTRLNSSHVKARMPSSA